MKKNATKVILLVLSLALLVGSVIGISVSASDSAPVIISKNVKTNGNFCLMFAVDPATVAGDDVTVTIYNQDPTGLEGDALAAATVQVITKAKSDVQYEALNGDGVKDDAVIVFETAGVSAKDIADVWYITTESAGNVSAVETYSVKEYAFERLYKDGTVNATEKDEDDKKYRQQQFYLAILEMGSAAQELQVNYGKDNPERLAKEYTYVAVNGGTYTVDGVTASKGFVDAGKTVTLNPDPDTLGWKVYSYGQNGDSISSQIVAKDGTITVAGNTVVIPYDMGVTVGKYFEEIGNSAFNFDNMSYLNFAEQLGKVEGPFYLSKAKYSTSGDFVYAFKDSDDAEHGKVLSVSKSATAGGQALISFPIAEAVSDKANCVVFEYDFFYTGADFYFNSSEIKTAGTESTTTPFFATFNADTILETQGLTSSTLNKTVWVNTMGVDYDTTLTTNDLGTYGGDAIRLPGATDKAHDILPNKWYRITYEVYTDVNTAVLYVDGKVASVMNVGVKDIDNFNTISFVWDWRARNYEMMFDNVCGARIVKEYVAP